MVALYNAWNKISMSVDFYYKTVGAPQDEQWEYDIFWMRLFATVAGAFILFIYLFEKIDIEARIKKMFKHVTFPGEKQVFGAAKVP